MTKEPSNPPSTMVEWRATHKDGRVVEHIWAMRWYDARNEACALLNCETVDITVEQVPV